MGFGDSPVVRGVNAVAVGLLRIPVVGRVLGRGLVVIRYAGRRSGQVFQTPVGYRRTTDGVLIGVAAPDKKMWWRNFLGDGGPITLVDLGGRDRTGHAVAQRDARGRVTVRVRLDGADQVN
jgi:IS4 transposase